MINYTNKKLIPFLLLIGMSSVVLFSQSLYGSYWTEDNYTHYSKEEPLREVLKAMADQQGSHIIVSRKIEGNINAYFRNKSTADIFEKIKKTYNLVTYDDGDTLYVYSVGELKKVSIKMKTSPVSHLEQELINIGALNKKKMHKFSWKLNTQKNNVVFRAVPRFIEIARNIAYELEQNDYIYKWKDRVNIIHYSNEPPFSGVKYMKVMKIENKDIREIPSFGDTSPALQKEVPIMKIQGNKDSD